MKRTIIIALVFIAILLLIDYFASKAPVVTATKKHQKTEYIPLKRERSKDTLVVSGKLMVFFMPT